MLFHEAAFIFGFLPITLLLFFVFGARHPVAAKLWLTVASLIFYAWWKPIYTLLIVASALLNYAVSHYIAETPDRRRAGWALGLGIFLDLGLLAYFKYANFFVQTVEAVTGWGWSVEKIVLPLAISFFTFTQIAYLIDVYRDRSLHYRAIDYGLFVFFFPHLIAGPIVRHWEILPQLTKNNFRFHRDDFGVGLTIFLLGLYKKVLLADPLSVMSREVFGAVGAGTPVSSWEAWIGALAYTGQIYFDFSGYSDMAIGLARMFGIKFPQNFDSPYQATSIIQFWERWHITLTRFFREYVYFPLGGNRLGWPRQVLNILVTMSLSGLWHGAGWTFVLWGLVHGVMLVTNHFFRRLSAARGWIWGAWCRGGGAVLTFFLLVQTWVLFRAEHLSIARTVLKSMWGVEGFSFPTKLEQNIQGLVYAMHWAGWHFSGDRVLSARTGWDMAQVVGVLLVAWCLPNTQQLMASWEPILEKVRQPARWQWQPSVAVGLLLGATFFVVFKGYFILRPTEFLYFNF